jgi:hypothetical protein
MEGEPDITKIIDEIRKKFHKLYTLHYGFFYSSKMDIGREVSDEMLDDMVDAFLAEGKWEDVQHVLYEYISKLAYHKPPEDLKAIADIDDWKSDLEPLLRMYEIVTSGEDIPRDDTSDIPVGLKVYMNAFKKRDQDIKSSK